MKYTVAAVALTAMFAGSALAQNTTTSAGSSSSGSAMKLSQSECTSIWQQAGGSASGLTEAQAKTYVTDFKAANPDGDTTLDQNEFMSACNKGLVKSASSSGASSGSSGSSSSSTDMKKTPGSSAK